MISSQWAQIRSLFEQALLLPPAERAAFVDTNCSSDDALRAQVEALLAADQGESLTELNFHAAAPDLLDAFGRDHDQDEREAMIGQKLGPWLLRAEIGRGGMGTVYLADRDDGEYTQQAVLKVLRPS